MAAESNTRSMVLLALALAAAAASGACSSGSCARPVDPRVDLLASSPGVRSRALAVEARNGGRLSRRERVAGWIERLEDTDATVRMQAIAALRSTTGLASDYRPFAAPAVRATHVEAWWAWWRREIARPDPALLVEEAPAASEPSAVAGDEQAR